MRYARRGRTYYRYSVARKHTLLSHEPSCSHSHPLSLSLPSYLQMPRVILPKDALEPRVVSMLTEDRMQTMMNYVEFLCHVHRQIQAKFQY